VHLPEGGSARAAVVLCPPLCRDLTSAHFTYRRLAEQLAEQGIAAIRFDYEGTGDSAGDDLGAPASWIAGIRAALDLARDTGAQRLALVGMRMGALLALAAVTAQDPGSSGSSGPRGQDRLLDALVLWDPCTSGTSFLRGQRALARLGGSGGGRDGGVGGIGDWVEVPGGLLSPSAAAGIERLRLAPRAGPIVPITARMVVLERPAQRLPAAILTALATASIAPPDRLDALGQPELLDVEPLHQEIPEQTLATITTWLDAALPQRPRRRAVTLRVPDSCRSRLEINVAGTPVAERPVRLGPAGLFGIATTRKSDDGVSDDGMCVGGGGHRPVVLFLNSGNDWHAGPGRSWVTLARTLAAAGVRCVRFDMSGLGDSSPRPGEPDHVVRSPAAFTDVIDAATAATGGDPAGTVLVGLCSGAYQALESAIGIGPAGVVAINPLLRFAPPEMERGPIDPRRLICRPATPAVAAYRRLPIPAAFRLPRQLAWRVANSISGAHRPANWLRTLVAGGSDVLIVGGRDETTPILSGATRDLAVLTRSGRLRIEVMPGLDHALLYASERERVLDLVAEHVLTRFGHDQVGTNPAVAPGHDARIKTAVQA
jgi:alpha-beta hydrolase superfamily lysophospholipase